MLRSPGILPGHRSGYAGVIGSRGPMVVYHGSGRGGFLVEQHGRVVVDRTTLFELEQRLRIQPGVPVGWPSATIHWIALDS